ncbi:MAG: helix-turn-helix domain-containing protein [Blautia massiliensis (ex Durand et al. 2017)]
MLKNYTGQTFSSLIQNIRLSRAAKMLKQPDRSVTAVMEEIGYSNITHFYKIFEKKVPYDTSGIPKYFISPVCVLSVYNRKEKAL